MTQDEIIEMACQAFGGVIKKEDRNTFIAFAKLVAAKRKWVGLTVQEIEELGEIYAEKDRKIQMWGLFAVAIEEKLKEKNAL